MSTVKLHINHSSTDSPFGTSGIDWVEVSPINDTFIFSNGGVGVSDGENTPTTEELNRAAVQLSASVEVEPNSYFLLDYSDDELKEIFLAGNQNKRYVFCAEFDGATATEPQLEAWDNASMNSIANACLGGGSPSQSWYRAISTKSALPGTDWVGTHLGGNGASYIVLLNGGSGALSVATNLHFNFKIIIPAGYITPSIHTPVLAIVFTTN
jgi:hypothetical protein